MTKQKLYLGFDPTFIDINILPFTTDYKELINQLPEFGNHHTTTNIEFRPGGNGFNVARTLASLGNNVHYIGPSNALFESLVKQLKLPINIIPIPGATVNYTAILNLRYGELQFNAVKGNLAPEHLNQEIVDAYNKSIIKPISNVALNINSIEWVSSLLLSLISKDDPLVYSSSATYQTKLRKIRETSVDGIIFIDPCDISHFSRIKDFIQILKTLKKLDADIWLSVNEYELKALLKVLNLSPTQLAEKMRFPIILHQASMVKLYGKDSVTLPTMKLAKTTTFVGAGDCFNGGFLHAYMNGNSIVDSLNFAIKCASFLIETGAYPNFVI
ncbi:MAG: PfkB family carbohydrate kinase [Candidatus Heimdallarchaeaceae archaeon]